MGGQAPGHCAKIAPLHSLQTTSPGQDREGGGCQSWGPGASRLQVPLHSSSLGRRVHAPEEGGHLQAERKLLEGRDQPSRNVTCSEADRTPSLCPPPIGEVLQPISLQRRPVTCSGPPSPRGVAQRLMKGFFTIASVQYVLHGTAPFVLP